MDQTPTEDVVERVRRSHAFMARAAHGLMMISTDALGTLLSERDRAVEALTEARDLLLERVQGSPARSAGHNARLQIESALSTIPPPAKAAEIDRIDRDSPLIEATAADAGDDAAVDAFLADVRAELIRARAKFPGDRIMTIALAEEFGELAKAILDEPAANVRKEAVQTAVMAARVVLDGDGSVAEWRAARGLDPLVTP